MNDEVWSVLEKSLQEFAREIRNQALEEAAVVCETWQHSRYETVMRIRALKEISRSDPQDTK